MNKKILNMLSITMACGVVSISTTGEVHAQDKGNVSPLITNELNNLSRVLSNNKLPYGSPDALPFEWNSNPSIPTLKISQELIPTVNNDMKIVDGNMLAAHTATLKNSTGPTQTLSTASFDYTSEDSVTTTNTHSAGISETSEATMKFPFVSGTQSVTAKYDYGHSSSVTTKTTKKWSVPSQSITLPAGKTYKVNWTLETGKATGTTNLDVKVSGSIPYKFGSNNYMAIGQAINEQNEIERDQSRGIFSWAPIHSWSDYNKDKNTAIKNAGTADYSAEYGTQLNMEVLDVTNGNNSIKISSRNMNITPRIINK
ncbi:hypothetical protein EFN92_03805 [Lactococcus lactis]|nr:hypothetical protein [Lactococcus lactis]